MLFSNVVYENAKQPLKTSKRSKISFYLPPKALIPPHSPHLPVILNLLRLCFDSNCGRISPENKLNVPLLRTNCNKNTFSCIGVILFPVT